MPRRLDPATGAATGATAGVDRAVEHGAAIRPYRHNAAIAVISRAGVDNRARVNRSVASVSHARIGPVSTAANLDRAAARGTASIDARGAGECHARAGKGSGAAALS